jgi:resuscitation-promoting factor RpfB
VLRVAGCLPKQASLPLVNSPKNTLPAMADPNPHQTKTLTRPPWQRRRVVTPRRLVAALIAGSVLAFAASVTTLTYILQLMDTNTATVILDGRVIALDTNAATVSDLLTDMDITLAEGDAVSVDLDAPVQDGIQVALNRARPVAVQVDGITQIINTTLTRPTDILNAAGVTLSTEDQIEVNGVPVDAPALVDWPATVNQIGVNRAVDITVIDGATRHPLRTTGPTVGEALYEAGITLYLADAVTPDVNAPVADDMAITVERSVPARLLVDGTTVETRTRSPNVAGLLADAGVALLGLDYSIPNESSPVQPDMTVRVIRVREEMQSTVEQIPFGMVAEAEPQLELDQIRLLQPGEAGLRQRDVRVRFENEVVVSRDEERSTVIRQPKERVIAYGTNIVIRDIATPQGPRTYWRRLRLYATRYTPDGSGAGVVRVDPTLIPSGSEVYIPGYGVGEAIATDAPRDSRLWIDLGYAEGRTAAWERFTDVYLLTPVPDDISYILPD